MQEQNFKELLQDDSFINYCLKRNQQDIDYWENWLKAKPEHGLQIEELKQLVIAIGFHAGKAVVEQDYLRLRERISPKQQPEKPRSIFNLGWMKYAAVLVMLTSIMLIWYNHKYEIDQQQLSSNKAKDIGPGGNKAILTLADGSRISLTNATNGKLKDQLGITITKTAEGKIVYSSNTEPITSNRTINAYNTIETPRGGQYEVILPDGSKAWLNAGSSLKYPVNFTNNERRVEMTGEVYFEIAKDKLKPFRVKATGQEVEVLGTHFNINAYTDESAVRTTLLEGSVKIASSETKETALIKPGERAELLDHIKITTADIEKDMAWKNGDFIFKGEDLQSILRKVSRWYDVDISCSSDLASLRFDGMVSRSRNISAVLNMIQSTGKVHAKMEGRRITVMK